MAPIDKDKITQKSGVIYRFQCVQAVCEEEYIGEAARTFDERHKEHLRAPPQSMAMVTPQVITLVWSISP